MSIQVLYQADVLLDGIAASTEFCRIKFSLNQPVKDRRAFQDVAVAYLPGIYSATADGDFYYQTGNSGNFTENKLEGITVGPAAGAFSPMVLSLAADLVVGNLVNIWRGVNAKLEVGAQHGEILKGMVSTEAADRTVQALRLIRATNAVTGTSGLGTAILLPTPTTGQQVYSALHVVATTAGAAGTVFSIVTSVSSGLPTPTTRVTFVTGTSAVAGEWGSVVTATTSEPWYAAKWTGFGGVTGATISISAGIQ